MKPSLHFFSKLSIWVAESWPTESVPCECSPVMQQSCEERKNYKRIKNGYIFCFSSDGIIG